MAAPSLPAPRPTLPTDPVVDHHKPRTTPHPAWVVRGFSLWKIGKPRDVSRSFLSVLNAVTGLFDADNERATANRVLIEPVNRFAHVANDLDVHGQSGTVPADLLAIQNEVDDQILADGEGSLVAKLAVVVVELDTEFNVLPEPLRISHHTVTHSPPTRLVVIEYLRGVMVESLNKPLAACIRIKPETRPFDGASRFISNAPENHSFSGLQRNDNLVIWRAIA